MASRSTKTGKKKTEAAEKRSAPVQERQRRTGDPDSPWNQILPYVLGLLTVFITVCFLWPDVTGFVGRGIRGFLYGMFSCAAVLVPPLILNLAIFWRKDIAAGTIRSKIIFSLIILLFTSILIYTANITGAIEANDFAAEMSPKNFWEDGVDWTSRQHPLGGVVGGILGWAFYHALGKVGTVIVCCAMLFVFGVFLIGLTPQKIILRIKYALHEEKIRRAEDAEAERNRAAIRAEKNRRIRQQAQQQWQEEPAEQDPVRPGRRKRIDPSSVEIDGADRASSGVSKGEELVIRDAYGETDENGQSEEGDWIAETDEGQKPKIPLIRRKKNGEDVPQSSVSGSNTHQTGTDSPASSSYVIDPKVYEAVLERQKRYATAGKESDDIHLPAGKAEIPASSAASVSEAVSGTDPDPAADVLPDDAPFDTEGAEIITEKERPVARVIKKPDTPQKSERSEAALSDELLSSFIKNSDGNGEGCAHPDEDGERSPGAEEDIPEDELSEEELEIARRSLSGTPKTKPTPPPYRFPPLSLLATPVMPENTDISEELQTTGKKLVDTLTSFKVHTRIVNVSRGPTITRYELVPEEGTRVRAIANLVDDISLNLAAAGVRIEAPIPGKAAVGIEVPNRVVATVYLRELLETANFTQAPSKVTVALGEDVAGEPICVDIAKMPHLLIAGATGMGKSVCLNSMIVSLLYKGSPDEVKLILIDPKKVEFNIYNGLPHLLVPVVSDPKKAAGSLAWAVTEMERRFSLIEEVGVRDLKTYNKVTAADPEKEYLPQIVIIIDELADLMMTAGNDVEESICRLAQKARAAGMHLIIGTQRPSVDVITGLIKANIPSRIAFRVSSQIDSRTILDIAGAEKLIGRGDMLYAPVGSNKPARVQGSYVGEDEIETIVSFIKDNYGTGTYDDEIISSIEREASRCGMTGKKGAPGGDADGAAFGDGEADPMLKAAIELAVESGKISTSLIQRRLSLGYGRAAKLIDRMEQMGVVSEPDGQKPRTVLITKEQFMEMVINDNLE